MGKRDDFLKIESWEEYIEKRNLFEGMSFQSDKEVFSHWKVLLEIYMKKHDFKDRRKSKTMYDDYFGTIGSNS